ncbi:MAG: ATP-binding cassette domain-containing protein [Synergistaceae bacterium]|jgi:ABC-type branched-subunit amino acid transport system ATPase component|nr:ATP-binding cassette domain-containing protein [Synergistaceae bacterium]
MALLDTKDVSINFGGLWAVKDVDFSIGTDEIVGLIGPNGSGKTTFLNIISGLYRATNGAVTLRGEDITSLRPFEIFQRGIARTYQSSRLCWDLSVADNILMGLYTKHKVGFADIIFRPKKADNEIYEFLQECMDMLSYFNPSLFKLRYDLTKNIPHIDRRRIEICRALVGHPTVLLLDEPTAGLNDEETMQMMMDIHKIKRKIKDICIIIIEHDMKVMERVPERIVVFNAGRKIAEGIYGDIVKDHDVINAYLGGAAV